MKQQAQWAIRGLNGRNDMFPFVQEYFEKQNLAKLGLIFNSDDITTSEVECFNIIKREINKYEEQQSKKNSSRKR